MADIASLGLEVRSDSVRKGAADLDKLTGAATRAEAAAKGLASGSSAASKANAAIAGSADHAAASLTRQAGAARVAAVAVNDNTRRMGGSMSGLAAQFQDIGVTAAMGMSPAIIALQQGTQIAGQMEMAMQGGATATGVLAQAFKSLFSPMTFITIALTALAAAGLQMVDWPKSAAWAIDLLADSIQTIAPYAAAAAAALALIYAPTIITSLVHLIGMIARVGVAALSAAGSFTAAWLAAVGPVGWLIAGIGAVAAAAFLLRDQIKSAIGIDVVAIVRTAGNYIINSFEAAYADVKFVWSNFGDMMGAAVVGGVNIAIRAIDGLIKKATDGIDQLIRAINPYLEKAGFEGLSEIGGSLGIQELPNPYADRFSRANEGHAGEIDRIMGQDRLGQFGAAIAEGASFASGKLKELADWMGKVDEKKKKKGGKTDAEKYEDIVKGAERRIATLQAEYDALGMTEFAAKKLAYETEMLNEAQRKGITLSAAQRAEIAGLAGTMANIEIATAKMREALDFARDVSQGFMSDMMSGLREGKSLWASFADAAVNALQKIADKLLDSAFDGLFNGGGIWGFLSGMFGGGSRDPWAGMRGYANGTPSAAAGMAWVGERGPEIVRFRGGEEVIPNHMLGGANNNQPPAMNINYAPVYNVAQGADPRAIAELRQAQEKDRAEFAARTIETVRKANKSWVKL